MNHVKQAVHYWCSDTIEAINNGRDVCVAVLDTGLAMHPDFTGRVMDFKDCVNGRHGLYDDSGHGTHVTGILAGDGRAYRGVYGGMAPKARLIIVKVLDEGGEGSIRQILEGIRWIFQNRLKYGIHVVNLSVGAKTGLEETKENELLQAVEQLWDAGIAVVVSAGNYGPGEGTVAVPGNSRKVITVGAMGNSKVKNNCSGLGPTQQCIVKPDLVAPGYQIMSCNADYPKARRPYVMKSGTSMATPMVAGAIALYLSKYPDAGNVEIKLLLRERCDRAGDKMPFYGWGILNVEKLLKEKEGE